MATCQDNLLTEVFYKTLLDSLFDAVYTVDIRHIITYWNDSCARITGYSAAEVVGQPNSNLIFSRGDGHGHSDSRSTQEQQNGVQMVIDTSIPGTWKGYFQRKNGQRIPIMSHISPIFDRQGNTIGAVEIFRDISAQLALEQAHRQVLQISRTDQLTGLSNRTASSELLKAEIARSRRYCQPLSLVMADIDHFKRVNDRYGHDVGDQVLAAVGGILRHNLRAPDAVGRWGGEEFLIIAPGSVSSDACRLAERIGAYIKQVKIPAIGESISASFGVSELTDDQDSDKLLYAADMALYKAKQQGRDRVVAG